MLGASPVRAKDARDVTGGGAVVEGRSVSCNRSADGSSRNMVLPPSLPPSPPVPSAKNLGIPSQSRGFPNDFQEPSYVRQKSDALAQVQPMDTETAPAEGTPKGDEPPAPTNPAPTGGYVEGEPKPPLEPAVTAPAPTNP